MSDAPNRQARYPLRAVMRRTGLSADVIRAWERRYAAVAPERSVGGQRLYSELDVVRLALLGRATGEGHSIGEIARLDAPALEALLHGPSAQSAAQPGDADVTRAVTESLGAAERLDAAALGATLKRAALQLGVDRFVGEVIGRFLTDVGTRWHLGSLSPAHEHLASDTVRRVLAWIGDAYEIRDEAPSIVVATPSGEMHELGAMTAAAAAVGEGWRVIYLGPNLPAHDIVNAAVQVGAQIVALSIVYANGDATRREVTEVAHGVPQGVAVLVGGTAAQGMAVAVTSAGARVLSDIDSFRNTLRMGLAGSRSRPRPAR